MRKHESTARLFAHAMQKLGLPAERLAPKVGRSTSSVSRYRNGKTGAPNEVLLRLCELCGYATLYEFYHEAL